MWSSSDSSLGKKVWLVARGYCVVEVEEEQDEQVKKKTVKHLILEFLTLIAAQTLDYMLLFF